MSSRAPGDHRDGGHRPAIRVGRAVLLTLIAIVVAILLLTRVGQHPAARTAVATAPAPTPAPPVHPTTTTTTTPTSASTLPASRVHVQVLNGILSGSVSSQWTAELAGRYGYLTDPPLDATHAVDTSSIYVVSDGYLPEADRLASQVGLPEADIVPSTPPPADAPIPAAVRAEKPDLILVVGPDLATKA